MAPSSDGALSTFRISELSQRVCRYHFSGGRTAVAHSSPQFESTPARGERQSMSETGTLTNTTSAFRALDTTRALRPAHVHCPNCIRNGAKSTLLVQTLERIDFHHCSQCGGAWFYEKDADLALRAAGARAWPPPQLSAAVSSGAAPLQAWTCPCCGGALIEIQDRRGTGAAVRRCLICYGGWMDHSDLQRVTVASSHLMARFGRLIRNLALGS